MLRKKYTIQKSIRFDEKLAEDLEYLAGVLDRTQNDLVNIAVEDLIKENRYYFAPLIVKDMLFEYFELISDKETVKFQNVLIDVWNDKEDKANMRITLFDEEEKEKIIETFEKKYDYIIDLEKELLKYVSFHIKVNSQQVEEYLNQRLDYK